MADLHIAEREAQILHLLATGHTNQQIGGQLHLATGTVRVQVSKLYRNLGVTSRSQAAVCAVGLGLSSTASHTSMSDAPTAR